MKKAILSAILLILIALTPVVAANPETKALTIKGFYEQVSTPLVFEVFDSTGSSALLRFIDIPDSTLNTNVQIFTWKLSGRANNDRPTTTVAFTFSPMQAYLDGIYCKPAYTITMNQNQTTINGTAIAANQDTFYSATAKTFSVTKEQVDKSANPNGFLTKNTLTFTGRFSTNRTGDWVRSGSCSIKITDYNRDFVGDFTYTSEVQVTISTT